MLKIKHNLSEPKNELKNFSRLLCMHGMVVIKLHELTCTKIGRLRLER